MYRSLWLCSAIMLLIGCSKPVEHPASNHSHTSFLKPCRDVAMHSERYPLPYSECGSFTVLEDPADSEANPIDIHVLRLPALDKSQSQDPLLLIAGGPGGSSVEMAFALHGAFSDIQKTRDLIFIDQRGTGRSAARRCEADMQEQHLLTDEQLFSAYREQLAACAASAKESVLNYTTDVAVGDFDAVRAALGYSRWNVWGVSYGTRVALEYARQYPDSTRALILDGVAPVENTLPRYFARDAQQALVRLSEACEASSSCYQHYGVLAEKAARASDELIALARENRSPIIEVKHPVNQKRITMRITPTRFSRVVHNALYSRDAMTLLPILISNTEARQYELLATTLLLFEHQQQSAMAEAMHFGVVCNEDYQSLKQIDAHTEALFLGRNFVAEYQQLCTDWDQGGAKRDSESREALTVPTLLLSGYFDPVTPETWAETLGSSLTTSWHVSVPGGNHGVSTEGCMPLVIGHFLQTLTLDQSPDCTLAIKTMPLFLGAKVQSMPTESLQDD